MQAVIFSGDLSQSRIFPHICHGCLDALFSCKSFRVLPTHLKNALGFENRVRDRGLRRVIAGWHNVEIHALRRTDQRRLYVSSAVSE